MLTNKYLVNIVYLTTLVKLIHSDCGEPGHSRNTLISDGLRVDRIYPESQVIRYRCIMPYNDDAPIIGPEYRICIGGRWYDSIPKCRKYLYCQVYNIFY